MAKIKIKTRSGEQKSKAASSPRQSATPTTDSSGAGSQSKPNPFSARSTGTGRGATTNPFTKKSTGRALPTFGKKAGPLSTPMGRGKSGSSSGIRDEFPTTDTSWIESGMTVRVKWICESGSLGGPTPVEFEGDVTYVDGVWLNMKGRAFPHPSAHVMRAWIFEAKEVKK